MLQCHFEFSPIKHILLREDVGAFAGQHLLSERLLFKWVFEHGLLLLGI
jgi:hypothetical protein